MRRVATAFLVLAVLVPASSTAAPNDELYRFQWGLTTVYAEAAWTVTKGAGAVIAIVDTGVDLAHPDLQGRLVDGADFVDDSDGENPPDDENGHGTLIAGLIVATTGNQIGVASMAPLAKVMPVRVLDEDGTGTSEDVGKGIRWAVDRDADVVNLSLAQEGDTTGGGLLPSDLLRDPAVDQAIRYAAGKGAAVVIAAGNDHSGAQDETSYDATVGGAVVVGASTKDDKPAAYSNYGSGLDLLAPGGGSSTDARSKACSEKNSIVSTWWNPATKKATYGGGCGTSMAVAFVSGVAALLRTRGMSNVAAVDQILRTADRLPTADRDKTGRGRLNAARAVGAPIAVAVPPTQTKQPPPASSVSNQGEVPAPGPTSRTPGSSPAQASSPTQALGPVVPGGEGSSGGRGPVGLAAFLAVAVVVAHYALFLSRARGQRSAG